jgi:probable F420-dependent oxidoreductase
MFMTDRTIGPIEFAREVEARGLASIYLPEHTHIPVSRHTPPPTGDAELPEEYRRTYDPLVALGAMAAVTERVALGTGILLLAQRDPIVTAKAIASIDVISGGRFVCGVGFGWNEDELAHHGVAMRDRRAVARERLLAMRRLWCDDVAEFDGEHVRLAPSWSWPKPVRPLGPPVLIGGAAGPRLFAHIAEYADGWMPIGGGGVRAALPELERACGAAGRSREDLRIVPFGALADPAKFEYYASLGIDEIVLRVRGGTAETVLPQLDRITAVVERASG